jgi:glycosyltransferase involved in cell wall biosynthesis
MRIAQVAPLYESVPPRGYGGTERVVSYLTEELVHQGHEVTLFASGDSRTQAELVPICPRSLRLDPNAVLDMPYHFIEIERVAERAEEFDVIHHHVDFLHFPVSRRMNTPSLTTLHGRLDLPDLGPLYREFSDAPVVSISDAQRIPLPDANFVGTVYHGLPRNLYSYHQDHADYFAFVGRISPEKRVDRAIEIATRLGVPLKIAAKIDRADREYFERDVKHLLDNPLVEFVGEVSDADKDAFLGNARALLFPIDWPEPFGLVMIEAMACGVPVVAFRAGSVPEVIDDGVTGFVVDDMEAAVAAAARVSELDRRGCRAVFETRFSAERMAADYAALYSRLRAGERASGPELAGGVAA